MTPAFLYFDLGNVLLHFDHRLAATQMAEVAKLELDRVWDLVFATGDLLVEIETGRLGPQEFYEHFCRETGTRADYGLLEEAGSAIFTVNAPMLPIITHLEAAGHRLGVLSNTSESHWRYIARQYPMIPRTFEPAALSFKAGVMKPDPAIYQYAADLAGVAPEEIFFTDDRAENVAGALRAGFDAVPFTGPADLARELRRRGLRFNY